MRFSDLKFDHIGCCGTHKWAEVRHPNGMRSDVYDKGAGVYEVVTFCGNTVWVGPQQFTTETAVMARLSSDALLSA